MITVEDLVLKVSAGFIKENLGKPRWSDLLFGLENYLLDPAAIAVFAADDLAQDDPPAEVLDLAVSTPEEPMLDHVRRLARRDDSTTIASARVWLYLALAWLYANRTALTDPLGSVETVYAEFDYPESIAGFVRYMPSDEPSLGERSLNEARLIRKWESFLDSERKALSRSDG